MNSLTGVLYCCLCQQLSFFKLNIWAPREYCAVKCLGILCNFLEILLFDYLEMEVFFVELSLILSMILVLNTFGGYETSLLLSDLIMCIILISYQICNGKNTTIGVRNGPEIWNGWIHHWWNVWTRGKKYQLVFLFFMHVFKHNHTFCHKKCTLVHPLLLNVSYYEYW